MLKATCFSYFLRSTMSTGKTGFRSRQLFEKFLKSSSSLYTFVECDVPQMTPGGIFGNLSNKETGGFICN